MIESIIRGLPYFFVFFVLLFLYHKDNNYKRIHGRSNVIIIRWSYFILLVFIGLRGFVMTDFISYYPFFELIQDFQSLPLVILAKGWEPGFVYYTYFCKLLSSNYFVWIFLSTAIDLWLLYIAIKRYSVNHILSLILFFTAGGLPIEMNILRNAKAILLFLIAIKYLHERKLIKYVGLVSFAMAFHMSAVVYLPLYFVLNRRWPKWFLLIIFICGNIILFTHISILSDVLSQFTIADDDESKFGYWANHHIEGRDSYGLSFGTLERIFTYFVLLYFYDESSKENSYMRIFFNMYIFIFIAYFYFSESTIVLQRIQYLFIPCFWFFYPYLIGKFVKEKRYILKTAFWIIIYMKLFMIGTVANNKYENLLFGISKYEDRVGFTERNMGM